MTWFPQLASGTSTQLPIRKTVRWREISNEIESGECLRIGDLGEQSIAWNLTLRDLSDSELQAITTLFAAVGGRYGSFGFVDPFANLLAGSEDLTRPEWQTGLLSCTSGLADPRGGTGAWQVQNTGSADLELQQSLAIPGGLVSNFSLYIRGEVPSSLRIGRDSKVSTVLVDSTWRRVWLSGAGDANVSSSTFGIHLAAGQTVEVWGMQVEAQPFPSAYKALTGPNGVYLRTSFASDELKTRVTGPGRTDCDIQLISYL